jgi:hypothetical protein
MATRWRWKFRKTLRSEAIKTAAMLTYYLPRCYLLYRDFPFISAASMLPS